MQTEGIYLELYPFIYIKTLHRKLACQGECKAHRIFLHHTKFLCGGNFCLEEHDHPAI